MTASVKLLACISLLGRGLVQGLQWPAVQQSPQEMLPNIELSLAPPQHPWPQVAAELGNLEESREAMENANMARLQQDVNKAILDARRRIGDTIGRVMRVFDDAQVASATLMRKSAAMLQQLPQNTLGPSVLAVKVNVLPASPPDPALRPAIDNLESLRADREKDMFETAVGEFSALTSFVVNELEAQIESHINSIAGTGVASFTKKTAMAFLERGKQLPAQANVRVLPTDVTYPTVSSMVQGLEARRDIAENLERKLILDKQLDLLMACNRAIEEGLGAAISRILAQYGSATKSIRVSA